MPAFAPLTRQDALLAWRDFKPRLAQYAAARNHVIQGHGNVSGLGASIRFRTLLEDEIIAETLALESFPTVEKWLQEVCWRRYWKGWMEQRPEIWTQWRQKVRAQRHSLPSETLARADAVAAGESGVACMDTIARELIATGYLHNHARMWWASFWIHVERLPWELGADFFFRHLIDADPASNTLSWRWVAGLQTPGKTYLVRRSNIDKYAPFYLAGNDAGHERLADGAVTARVAEIAADIPRRPLPQYPTTVSQTNERTGLWLHPDDLTPEVGPLEGVAPVSIAACITDDVYRNTYHLSSQRIAALQTVLRDGLHRAAAHYTCPFVVVTDDNPVQGLVAWAQEHQLAEVIAFAPTVGPIHDLVPRLEQQLHAIGTRLTLIRRPSDATAFSFATAGFFPFWQKMSRRLTQLHSS